MTESIEDTQRQQGFLCRIQNQSSLSEDAREYNAMGVVGECSF